MEKDKEILFSKEAKEWFPKTFEELFKNTCIKPVEKDDNTIEYSFKANKKINKKL